MSYRFLEINLLPPELQPGPAVRYRVIFIWAIILVTAAFLMLDSFWGLTRISQNRETITVLQGQVDNQDYIRQEHRRLKDVDNYVMKTGRLVSMASADYLDLPLVANRIARLLPDGVFLERITNNRPGKGSMKSDVAVTLVASREDPGLVLRTLNRFKEDPMLANCYMRLAEREERALGQLLDGNNINWTVAGPDVESDLIVNHFVFDIHSLVESPIDGSDFRVVYDDSRHLADFARRMEESGAGGTDSDGSAVAPASRNAPAGVTVEATN